MLGMDELRLGGYVAGVLHGVGRVDDIPLPEMERQLGCLGNGHAATAPPKWALDGWWAEKRTEEAKEGVVMI